MRCLAHGGTGGWVILGLVFKWFCLCVCSYYLMLPRVSSLVIWSLGVSALIPKAEGLISGQEQSFHKWIAVALSEIKINIQKTIDQR